MRWVTGHGSCIMCHCVMMVTKIIRIFARWTYSTNSWTSHTQTYSFIVHSVIWRITGEMSMRLRWYNIYICAYQLSIQQDNLYSYNYQPHSYIYHSHMVYMYQFLQLQHRDYFDLLYMHYIHPLLMHLLNQSLIHHWPIQRRHDNEGDTDKSMVYNIYIWSI